MWCNSSAVKHTSVEQQLYVSKALLLCVALLSRSEIQELRQGNAHAYVQMYSCFPYLLVYYEVSCPAEMFQCMLGGVQCRLDSGIERIRRMGMIVGECLSHKLDTPGSQLKFQVSKMKAFCMLQKLQMCTSHFYYYNCGLEIFISFLDSFSAN